MPTHVETAAILLRSVDYGEADRIVTLLGRARGKRALFARSIRKSKRRFRGGVGPFSVLEVSYQETSPDKLGRLTDSEAVRVFERIPVDPFRLAAGSHVLTLLDATLEDGMGGEASWDSVLRFFEWLDGDALTRGRIEAGALRMQLRILAEGGYLPDLHRCAETGTPILELSSARLDPSRGLVPIRAGVGQPGELLDGPALFWLAQLVAGRFPDESERAQAREVALALNRVWEYVLDRQVRTWPMVASTFGY